MRDKLNHFISTLNVRQKALLLIIGSIIVLFLLSTSYFIYHKKHKQAFTFYGNVDIRYVNLAFRVGGRITTMPPQEGDFVKQNEVLAILDKAPYLAALERAEAQMTEAQANFAKLQHGNRPEEIKQAQAKLAQQQAVFVNSEINLNRQIKLLPTGATTKESYDNAVALRDEAQASLNNAQEALQLATKGFREEDIAFGQATFAAAQANLLSAQINLGDTVLVAPEDGQLLTRAQEPGAVVAPGSTVYTLSLLEPVWVRAYIEEPYLTRIQPGMHALIYADGHDKPFSATVGYISPQAEFTPKNVETTTLRTSLVYRIRLIAQDPKHILRQGMPVTIQIKTR